MDERGVSATDQARRTYYDLPIVRAPHWRWLVILYFFFQGTAGAVFAISTLADLFGRDRRLTRIGRYLSFLLGLPSPVLLTLDLGRPERALHMFRIIKLKSPMSLGAWVLLITGVVSAAAATLQIISDVAGHTMFATARRMLGIVGFPFSLFISGYTGTLLEATAIPLWARSSPLLGPLFFSSSFSSGLSVLGLASGEFGSERAVETARALRRAETLALAAELGLLATLVRRLGRLGRPLTAGKWGAIFWPVSVGAGVVAPLAIHLRAALFGHAGSGWPRRLSAGLALLGGFSLRVLIIFAGRESARRPDDYLEYTK